MSFIAKNPLSIPNISGTPPIPKKGTRGIFAKNDGWYEIDDTGNVIKIANINDAQIYADNAEKNAKAYADNKSAAVERSTKVYADSKDNYTLSSAKAYTDDKFSNIGYASIAEINNGVLVVSSHTPKVGITNGVLVVI